MQRIFKKSCKQDMIDLFNILPNEVKYIEKIIYSKNDIKIELLTKKLFGKISISTRYTDYNFNDIFKIDFETDDKTVIIERPKETK